MKTIKPLVVYKCKTHKILPDAIWGHEEVNDRKEYFYCYHCSSCPDQEQYFYLAYGMTKADAEDISREFWNEVQ